MVCAPLSAAAGYTAGAALFGWSCRHVILGCGGLVVDGIRFRFCANGIDVWFGVDTLKNNKTVELSVGAFALLALLAILFLSLKVVNQGMQGENDTYTLYAKFDNIGGLKARSAVKLGGVNVGRVQSIRIDNSDYTPIVELAISKQLGDLPDTTSVAILTSGLLGEQYIGLQPGFLLEEEAVLQAGDYIEDTKSAIVLEDLIGQFLFNRTD